MRLAVTMGEALPMGNIMVGRASSAAPAQWADESSELCSSLWADHGNSNTCALAALHSTAFAITEFGASLLAGWPIDS
jgi:hypothetical protein